MAKCVSYTEKSFVIRGNVTGYDEELEGLGGTFNKNLKDGSKAWVFPKFKQAKVEKFLIENKLNDPKDSDKTKIEKSDSKTVKPQETKTDYVSFKQYLQLQTEVERLRAVVANLAVFVKYPGTAIKNPVEEPKGKSEPKKSTPEKDSDSDDEKPQGRLI